MTHVKLVTLDPGHFHAALVQKEMYPGVVDPKVNVYAPLGPDLVAHLNRIVGFNTRAEKPTGWELEVHATPDYLERFLAERPGNVVVLSGRNKLKIDYLLAALKGGMNVLADKPWIVDAGDFGKLEEALDLAEKNKLIAYDIMTERYEITSLLQKELIQDTELTGEVQSGSTREPGVYMESKHFLMKTVAGVPLRRPPWYFDTRIVGEGLADVGTHLVDLIPWMLFPGQALDQRRDVEVLSAKRWPTTLSRADFQRVTGADDFPTSLELRDGKLDYFCNTQVTYRVRGVHVTLDVLWDYEAAQGSGDTHVAIVRGSRASIEIHQGADQNYRPELYVAPAAGTDAAALMAPLRARIESMQKEYPGVGFEAEQGRYRLAIPESFRVGHEAHFAQVARQFLAYLEKPDALPAWEKANMLAKYRVTTGGVEKSRK